MVNNFKYNFLKAGFKFFMDLLINLVFNLKKDTFC